ncbi:TetR/AcrR family transcriptional regulator [Yinghuangia sp. YIM S09857]|uniref:TetR/AcrR family transcriptional regulator n=1 Tax=Yinghuangia sp. YIM S09857 TaxID=3436929 RepID=UPI003F5319DC
MPRTPRPEQASGPRADTAVTREALLRAGARLISRHGLGVPVSRIQQEADQRNKSAVQYHFGSVPGLAAAVLRSHRTDVDGRRAQALDALGPAPADADLRTLVGLLLRPAAEELRTASGRDYLRLLPQVAHLAQIRSGHPDAPPAQVRALTLLRNHLEGAGVRDADERLALVVQMQTAALADRARRIDEDEPDDGREIEPGHERFVDLVTDMLTAALTASFDGN